jgi:hypothetical protein
VTILRSIKNRAPTGKPKGYVNLVGVPDATPAPKGYVNLVSVPEPAATPSRAYVNINPETGMPAVEAPPQESYMTMQGVRQPAASENYTVMQGIRQPQDQYEKEKKRKRKRKRKRKERKKK